MSIFTIEHKCTSSSARTGKVLTSHGIIDTPAFMPVGTYAAIKTLSTNEIKNLNYKLILSNTYHLYLRPGIEILEKFQGLHNFMDWDGAILTDSGGFQIFSLSEFRKIDSNGVEFRSHHDGSKHYFTPEKIVDIQRIIGSDIMMVLDICPAADASLHEHEEAVQISSTWAKRCLEHLNNQPHKYGYKQIISPLIQGGTNKDLRLQSAEELIALNADMYAIGGLAVGEPKAEMLNIINYLNPLLPDKKPRYLMGVGTPSDIIECIGMGIDLFDCVIPTRNARNAQLFTSKGKLNIRNAKFKNELNPIDINNPNPISQNYSRAYLHHLFKTQEILGYRIATQHNLSFYNNLINEAKEAILANNFHKWSEKKLKNYNT